MKITAYPLYDHAATLAPAPEGRGWNFLCPAAFEAVWNGGPDAEDVEIRYADVSPGHAGFVQSQQGRGRITFHPGYQCQTERDIALWVRGPAQAPKDGLYPLESTLDTSVLPGTVLIDWQLMSPGQAVRFAAGEPFCTILPYPKAGENGVTVDVMPRAGDGVLAAYEAALERLAESQAAQRPPAPPVSCLCPTCGRVELLEEAIHSFLEQDYPGPKELIVVNDVAGQTLVYDHPEVLIVNLPCRFHSLAEAYKAAAGLASYDLLFLWPDDTISLPHRLSFSVAHLGESEALFKADKTWLWKAGELSGPEPEAPHGGGCWRRDGFVRRRGYPHAEGEFESALEAQCEAEEPGAVRVHPTAPDDIYLIRRVEAPEIQPTPEIPEGPIRLRPRWRTDYQALVAARLTTVPKPISYLICATERTGSRLFCDALTLTGIAGRPQECFHPNRFKDLPAQPDHAAYAAVFERIAQECTTPNGVFGANVQWWQLRQLVLKLRELPEYRGIGAGDLLRSWLPDARYIRLTRRDKVRQAVSHLKAIQTNDWWEMAPWARTPPTSQGAQPAFDADGIEHLLHRIRVHEAAWQLFFEDCGIQPLDVVYEDFVQAQATTTLHVLAELKIPTPPDLAIAQPRYKKQSDGTSEEWVRHYRELRGIEVGTAAVDIPQEDRDILSSHGPALAVPPRPLIQPHACQERVLRIVVYSMQRSDELPALLARSISRETVHTAHCVWYPPARDLPCEEGTLDSKADPASAAAALAAADVVLIHDGEVAPRHSAMLADKALVILAREPHAQHSPWLSLGFPGVLLSPSLAGLPAFQGWPHLALPWGSPQDGDRFWMPLIARALPPAVPHGRVFHRSLAVY